MRALSLAWIPAPDKIGTEGVGRSTAMSRYERMNYFERLVELHIMYAMRGDEDRTGVTTIDEAIAWAEAEMTASPAPEGRGTGQPE
jgi:hypothetical protein